MDNMLVAGATLGFRRCGLAAGTTNTFTTSIDMHYSIKGQAYSAGALSNYAGPTVDANTGLPFIPVGPNQACVFLFALDGSGTFAVATRVAQGTIVSLDGSTDGSGAGYQGRLPEFPAIPDGSCVYGWCIVKVGSGGAAWTFGTSNNSGVTNTAIAFTAGVTVPDRPRG